MLESTQRSVFHHYPVSNAEKPSQDIRKQYINKFQYYISPEDTTAKHANRRLQMSKYEMIDPRGMLKTAFWIAISISLTLLIGHFC